MTTKHEAGTSVDELSGAEREALVSAAVWYAKYHQGDIPSQDDGSAYAMVRREHFESLYGGLRKLGIRLRRPPQLGPLAER